MAKKKMDDTGEAPEVQVEAPPQDPVQLSVSASFTANVYRLGQLAQSGNASEGELRELWNHLEALKPEDKDKA